jgi:hypothetical protein
MILYEKCFLTIYIEQNRIYNIACNLNIYTCIIWSKQYKFCIRYNNLV